MIKLYFNDNLVENFENDTFSNGKTGFVSFEDVNTAFDNVEVFLLD